MCGVDTVHASMIVLTNRRSLVDDSHRHGRLINKMLAKQGNRDSISSTHSATFTCCIWIDHYSRLRLEYPVPGPCCSTKFSEFLSPGRDRSRKLCEALLHSNTIASNPSGQHATRRNIRAQSCASTDDLRPHITERFASTGHVSGIGRLARRDQSHP